MSEPITALSRRHVFVYGTLRQGELRDITRMRPAGRFIGRASVSGVLYHLGSYPGLVLGAAGAVVGEVYDISAELELQLDLIEEVWPQPSGEYRKRQVLLRLVADSPAGALELDCLVYELALERSLGRPVIASGDWQEGRQQRS